MRVAENAPERAEAVVLAFPDSPDRRLRVALRHLDAALAEQKAAVAHFRAQIAELSGAVSSLQGSTLTFHDRLAGVAADTARANAAARQLMATADAMQARL